MNRRLQALVAGRVQGVSFRAFTMQEAKRLGLTGWVRNLADGRVEFLAEGEESPLHELLLAAKRGPPIAHVDSLAEEWTAATGEFTGFVIAASGA